MSTDVGVQVPSRAPPGGTRVGFRSRPAPESDTYAPTSTLSNIPPLAPRVGTCEHAITTHARDLLRRVRNQPRTRPTGLFGITGRSLVQKPTKPRDVGVSPLPRFLESMPTQQPRCMRPRPRSPRGTAPTGQSRHTHRNAAALTERTPSFRLEAPTAASDTFGRHHRYWSKAMNISSVSGRDWQAETTSLEQLLPDFPWGSPTNQTGPDAFIDRDLGRARAAENNDCPRSGPREPVSSTGAPRAIGLEPGRRRCRTRLVHARQRVGKESLWAATHSTAVGGVRCGRATPSTTPQVRSLPGTVFGRVAGSAENRGPVRIWVYSNVLKATCLSSPARLSPHAASPVWAIGELGAEAGCREFVRRSLPDTPIRELAMTDQVGKTGSGTQWHRHDHRSASWQRRMVVQGNRGEVAKVILVVTEQAEVRACSARARIR